MPSSMLNEEPPLLGSDMRPMLGAERRGDRGAAHALDLCDEALVHAEDVVGVVAAQPEELEDVRDLVRVRVRVRARMRLRVRVKVEG